MTQLIVLDHGQPITFTFADLLKYHGAAFPGGVAHAFKVMERAFPLLSETGPVDRYEIHIITAFPGPGARDAFEMVTRAVTGNRFTVDPSLGGPDVLESANGRYFFRLQYRSRVAELSLRPGIVRDEFIALSRKKNRTEEEEKRLTWLKQDMADRLMSTATHEAYDARIIQAG
ncbi:MAG: hypothetical protein GC183_14305 [Thiobacillus sp.]|nr:hypothetical protein [Thiobacillus sp.]